MKARELARRQKLEARKWAAVVDKIQDFCRNPASRPPTQESPVLPACPSHGLSQPERYLAKSFPRKLRRFPGKAAMKTRTPVAEDNRNPRGIRRSRVAD